MGLIVRGVDICRNTKMILICWFASNVWFFNFRNSFKIRLDSVLRFPFKIKLHCIVEAWFFNQVFRINLWVVVNFRVTWLFLFIEILSTSYLIYTVILKLCNILIEFKCYKLIWILQNRCFSCVCWFILSQFNVC